MPPSSHPTITTTASEKGPEIRADPFQFCLQRIPAAHRHTGNLRTGLAERQAGKTVVAAHDKNTGYRGRHHRQAAPPDFPRRLDVDVPATHQAPATARRALSKLGLPLPLAFDAQVAVSELVSNSVRHAGLSPDDLIWITADWSGTRLRVRVRDRRPGARPPKVSGSIRPAPGAESGWGLFLVEHFTSRWGTSASGYWFELQQEPPSPGG